MAESTACGLVVSVVDLRPGVAGSRLARIYALAVWQCASIRWVPCRVLDGMLKNAQSV